MSSGGTPLHLRLQESLKAMYFIAQTESFERVRQIYIGRYMGFATDTVSATPTYSSAAHMLSTKLSRILPRACGSTNFFQVNDYTKKIASLLEMPGTPYQKVGAVLEWIKQIRQAHRATVTRRGPDTNHALLQSTLTEMLEEVSYAMLGKDAYPMDQILRRVHGFHDASSRELPEEQWNTGTCSYESIQHRNGSPERDKFIAASAVTKATLSKATPLQVLMLGSMRRRLVGVMQYSRPISKTVPDGFVVAHYLLRQSHTSWNRELVCDALLRQRTKHTVYELDSWQTSGIDNPKIDDTIYEQWWRACTKKAAKEWRIIRRQEIHWSTSNSSINNASVGDMVSRLKARGPIDIISGILKDETPIIKRHLLERIDPKLGSAFDVITQMEQGLGPIPDVALDVLTNKWPGNNSEPVADMSDYSFE